METAVQNAAYDPPLSRRDRIFATVEVLLGAAVVIGHNVYHVVPNEVPILVVILWASLFVRRKNPRSFGFSRPSSWKLTLVVAIAGCALLQLEDFVTQPLAHLIWHQSENVSSVITSVHGSPITVAKSLAIIWTFAAFGEEFAYRALLLRRSADALNGSRGAYAVATIASSVLFGLGHFYKGPTGVFDSAVSGLILAAAYLLTRRNLWAPILAHGLSDTFAILYTYFVG
jgi:hypothetical protein